jgi:hypothetical protein
MKQKMISHQGGMLPHASRFLKKIELRKKKTTPLILSPAFLRPSTPYGKKKEFFQKNRK